MFLGILCFIPSVPEWLKVSKVLKMLPTSVMVGFVNGLAIVIFFAQLNNFQRDCAYGAHKASQFELSTLPGGVFNATAYDPSADDALGAALARHLSGGAKPKHVCLPDSYNATTLEPNTAARHLNSFAVVEGTKIWISGDELMYFLINCFLTMLTLAVLPRITKKVPTVMAGTVHYNIVQYKYSIVMLYDLCMYIYTYTHIYMQA